MDDLGLYRQFGMVPPGAPAPTTNAATAMAAMGKKPQALGAFDPSTLQPSATGRSAISLDDLFGGVPGGKPGAPPPKGDAWGDYLKTMQYLTQPKTNAGPDARRAMAGMPAGPRNAQDDVQLQQPGGGQALMAMLFGGRGK